jgi:hypothetical protein
MTAQQMRYKPKDEEALMTELWDPEIADDPYKAVMFAFPWGKPDTPLHGFTGPRTWQCEDLLELTDQIKTNKALIASGQPPIMFRKATVSGRGPGKSALVAWLTWWFRSCVLGSTTIVTANTEAQLKTRTFAEITKWNTLAINGHWFETSVLSVKPAVWFEELLKRQLQIDTGYYYVQGQLWSEENPDAFAGVHNPAGVLLVKDEASGIPKPIWTVSDGFFTEPVLHRYYLAYSNGRRNSGQFFDCFHEDGERWRQRKLDSRTVEGIDLEVLNGIIKKHGADSDEAKVEVYGEFPSQGDRQFISGDVIEQAATREIITDTGAPLIMGVDPARFGRDSTVIRWRQGPDARSIPPVKLKKMDNYAVADKVAEWIEKTGPDAINIDAGNGVGVIDILRRKGYKVHEVWFGSTNGIDPEWADTRTQMYAKVREWLKGGCIDDTPDIKRDLRILESEPHGKGGDKTKLKSKDKMKSEGNPSPDDGDALALTFAQNVARRDARTKRGFGGGRVAQGMDYPIFG